MADDSILTRQSARPTARVRSSFHRPDKEIYLQMLAVCYRRAGRFAKALAVYELAITRFPRCTNCLKALIQLSAELGLNKSAQQRYRDRLDKILSSSPMAK